MRAKLFLCFDNNSILGGRFGASKSILWRRFGASKMHFSTPVAVALLLLFLLLLIYYVFICTSYCLWGFCVGLCSGMLYFMTHMYLVLQLSR